MKLAGFFVRPDLSLDGRVVLGRQSVACDDRRRCTVAFGGELPTYLASWVKVHFRIATQKLIGLAWRIGERR
jgi:hypothetical protein